MGVFIKKKGWYIAPMANKLIERIEQAGYSLNSIAGELAITKDELEKKINREDDFLYSEICYLRNLLNLSSKEVDSFFFGDGQEEADEEIERQNETRNYHLLAKLKKALEEINDNNLRLISFLDLLTHCSEIDLGYDSISLNEIALNLAKENDRLLIKADKECCEAY